MLPSRERAAFMTGFLKKFGSACRKNSVSKLPVHSPIKDMLSLPVRKILAIVGLLFVFARAQASGQNAPDCPHSHDQNPQMQDMSMAGMQMHGHEESSTP